MIEKQNISQRERLIYKLNRELSEYESEMQKIRKIASAEDTLESFTRYKNSIRVYNEYVNIIFAIFYFTNGNIPDIDFDLKELDYQHLNEVPNILHKIHYKYIEFSLDTSFKHYSDREFESIAKAILYYSRRPHEN